MLKYMEYVYAVYLNQSFSKAAEELYISQPALSASIKKVEEEIGLPIFDRSSNPIQPTAAGEYYIQCIEKIMEQEREMRAYFDSLIDHEQTTINVGGASFFCTYVIPAVMRSFKLQHPEYQINTLEANLDDLIKNLRTGAVDIIIDVEKKRESKFFDGTFWRREDVLLVVPSSYEINKTLEAYRLSFNQIASGEYLSDRYPNVNLDGFKDENMLLLRKGNDLYDRGIKMCNRAGFTPHVTMYLDQMLTAYQLSKNGKGVTFVRSEITKFAEATDQVYFYKIDDSLAYQNIMLYSKKTASLSKAVLDFIQFIKSNDFSSLVSNKVI